MSGALEARESPQSSDLKEHLESDLGDEASRTSESAPLDPSVRAIVARATEHARLQPSAPPPPPSVFDRDLRRRGRSKGLPVFPDFMSELLSSWGAPSRAILPRTHLANLEGAAAYRVATAPRVGLTFAMLAGATVRVVCAPSEQQARCDTEVVLAHLRRLGLALNREKSCLIPSRNSFISAWCWIRM